MKMKVCIWAASLGLASSVLAGMPQSGLSNGGMEEWANFERSADDWINPDVQGDMIPVQWGTTQFPPDSQDTTQPRGVVAQDASEKHGGEYSIRLEATSGSGVLQITQHFDLEANKNYVLRFWGKAENVVPESKALKVMIEQGEAGIETGRFWETAEGAYYDVEPSGGSFDWAPFEVPFTVADRGGIVARLQLVGSSGKIWIDDVEVVPAD